MRHLIITAWAVTLCAAISNAQPVLRKEPALYAGTERTSRVEVPPPGIRFGLRKPREFALAPLSVPERAGLAGPGPRLRTGVHRSLPANLLSAGDWETTAEGKRVWRMAIRSPGSLGIRVEFRNFSAGGGRVWLHNGDQIAGPYNGRGIFEDGHFWSATVFSDSVTLEYEPGPDGPEQTVPPFEIRTISHQARPALGAALPSPDAGKSDPADSCHLDPNCYPDWKSAMNMVGQISFEDNGSTYLCSGSLVSTRDNSFKPYFLTAGHCIHSEDSARTVEAYWTYQTSTCGGAPPASRDTSKKSTVGAHLIDFGSIDQGDYSLVLLKDVPAGVTFSGWDASDPPRNAPLAGLHHPAGSWKRISFGERVSDFTVDVAGNVAPASRYLEVLWDKGRTEPGSSGSPIFSSPGVIVGTLSYGPYSPDVSACQIDPSIAGYGRFSSTYEHLKDYLENLPAAEVKPDRTGLNFAVSGRTAPGAQTFRLTTQSTGQLTYKLRADAPWIQLSAITGNVSANAPAQVSIAIDPSQFDRPQQYTSTVTILSGAAAPQFLNVTVVVFGPQSNVLETITPNPVYQSGGQWSFKVRLGETGGVATHVTGMKIDGTDYSSSVKSWFGTDRIAANGAIEAPLQAPGSFPGGAQFFEFWGVDDVSGQPWYRVASVSFL